MCDEVELAGVASGSRQRNVKSSNREILTT
jgi:hypothetical protein